MLKKTALFTALLFTVSLVQISSLQANEAGFNRLKAAGQGVSTGEGEETKDGDKNNEKGSGKTGRMNGKPTGGEGDVIFLGVFETYVPSKRTNANLTVFAEPRKFLLGHRACMRTNRIRDQINQYFFNHPPKLDRRGVAETEGMDSGVREAIKKALKTKLEYFTSIYVISGRYGLHKLPAEMKELKVTDCAGIIAQKAEMDKAAK